jgi:hypothetical protein
LVSPSPSVVPFTSTLVAAEYNLTVPSVTLSSQLSSGEAPPHTDR